MVFALDREIKIWKKRWISLIVCSVLVSSMAVGQAYAKDESERSYGPRGISSSLTPLPPNRDPDIALGAPNATAEEYISPQTGLAQSCEELGGECLSFNECLSQGGICRSEAGLLACGDNPGECCCELLQANKCPFGTESCSTIQCANFACPSEPIQTDVSGCCVCDDLPDCETCPEDPICIQKAQEAGEDGEDGLGADDGAGAGGNGNPPVFNPPPPPPAPECTITMQGGSAMVGQSVTVTAVTTCSEPAGERERESVGHLSVIDRLLGVSTAWAATNDYTTAFDNYISDTSSTSQNYDSYLQEYERLQEEYKTRMEDESYQWSTSGNIATKTQEQTKQAQFLCVLPGTMSVSARGVESSEFRSANVICLAECQNHSSCSDGKLCKDYRCQDVACAEGCPSGTVCRSGETLCKAIRCGDARKEGTEECDDGNAQAGDGCSAACAYESLSCGNAITDSGEDCDDGNRTNDDGCDEYCSLEVVCGNNVLQNDEQCDDGNTSDGDGCDSLCRNETCGNGIIQSGEECDDGNNTDEDGCSSVCVTESCGDGTIQSGLGEECDDGNASDGDGCSSSCEDEPVCGDGVIEGSEECDDGNATNNDGCSSACEIENSVCNMSCDPSSLTVQVDDGGEASVSCTPQGGGGSNTLNWEVTTSNCTSSATTQSSSFSPTIACPSAHATSTVACSFQVKASNSGGVQCSPQTISVRCEYDCGNNVVDAGEDCDDGNLTNGDGCSSQCLNEETCGNGVVEGDEVCDDGNLTNCDGCNANCEVSQYDSSTIHAQSCVNSCSVRNSDVFGAGADNQFVCEAVEGTPGDWTYSGGICYCNSCEEQLCE